MFGGVRYGALMCFGPKGFGGLVLWRLTYRVQQDYSSTLYCTSNWQDNYSESVYLTNQARYQVVPVGLHAHVQVH